MKQHPFEKGQQVKLTHTMKFAGFDEKDCKSDQAKYQQCHRLRENTKKQIKRSKIAGASTDDER
jgi:hypothetical protein